MAIITSFATTKHEELKTVLYNLPDPGKVDFVVDGHAACDNPTDPLVAAALAEPCWSAPLKRMRVLYEGSHKEIIDDQKAKTTKA